MALGCSQILGIDFTNAFALVVNDITFHLMLSRKIIKTLSTRIIDVKTAFLYRELGDEIYMETAVGYVEHGYKIEENEVFILDKGIHGLVQAAQHYWKNFIISMEKFGFVLSKADPCFMYRETRKAFA